MFELIVLGLILVGLAAIARAPASKQRTEIPNRPAPNLWSPRTDWHRFHKPTYLAVATNQTWKDKGEEKQERTEWHRVVLFGKVAEIAAGMDAPRFGPDKTRTFGGRVKSQDGWQDIQVTVTFPDWCEVTVYRVVQGTRYPFTETVWWEETYSRAGGTRSEVPTDMWVKRPHGQLLKCAKAASLRAAFPEETDYTAHEDRRCHPALARLAALARPRRHRLRGGCRPRALAL